jgi:dUTP pyrophosphatase
MKKFLLQLVHEKVDLELYKNHSTYHDGDAGLDLFILDDLTIASGETVLVDLGVKCQSVSSSKCLWNLIRGKKYDYHSYFLLPRSSISKTPLIMKNSIGLIDKGYTGSIKAPLMNVSCDPFTIKRGERYVQLVNSDLSGVKFKLVKSLRKTTRGDGGFGSTNK